MGTEDFQRSLVQVSTECWPVPGAKKEFHRHLLCGPLQHPTRQADALAYLHTTDEISEIQVTDSCRGSSAERCAHGDSTSGCAALVPSSALPWFKCEMPLIAYVFKHLIPQQWCCLLFWKDISKWGPAGGSDLEAQSHFLFFAS